MQQLAGARPPCQQLCSDEPQLAPGTEDRVSDASGVHFCSTFRAHSLRISFGSSGGGVLNYCETALSNVPTVGRDIKALARVICALMLRDMRTRFGRNHWTYLIAICWPLAHLTFIVVAFTFVSRMLPFGNNSVIYIASGALPYVLCMYPARQSAMVFVQNRALLQFPLVHPVHLVLARVLLEALSGFVICIIFAIGLWTLGFDITPEDPALAITSIYAAVLLGISLGVAATVLTAILGMPGYFFFIGCMVVLYITAGVATPTVGTTELARDFISFNPLYHLVQWMRSAYYEDTHGPIELSRSYVMAVSGGMICFGLLGERLFRGKILK